MTAIGRSGCPPATRRTARRPGTASSRASRNASAASSVSGPSCSTTWAGACGPRGPGLARQHQERRAALREHPAQRALGVVGAGVALHPQNSRAPRSQLRDHGRDRGDLIRDGLREPVLHDQRRQVPRPPRQPGQGLRGAGLGRVYVEADEPQVTLDQPPPPQAVRPAGCVEDGRDAELVGSLTQPPRERGAPGPVRPAESPTNRGPAPSAAWRGCDHH